MSKDIKYEVCANIEHPELNKLNKLMQGILDLSKKYPDLIRYISSQEGESGSFTTGRTLEDEKP